MICYFHKVTEEEMSFYVEHPTGLMRDEEEIWGRLPPHNRVCHAWCPLCPF